MPGLHEDREGVAGDAQGTWPSRAPHAVLSGPQQTTGVHLRLQHSPGGLPNPLRASL